jgi:hypothetical protein
MLKRRDAFFTLSISCSLVLVGLHKLHGGSSVLKLQVRLWKIISPNELESLKPNQDFILVFQFSNIEILTNLH